MRRRQIKQKALETGIQSKLSKPQKASVFQPWQRIVPSGWQHNVNSKDSNAKLNQSNLTPGWPNT